MLAAVLLLAGGVVLTASGVIEATSPTGVVRGYFAALAHADAARALAYGTVPDGPRGLLTDTVLREQQRIAPIRDVRVEGVDRQRSWASVTVRYTLGFAGRDVPVSTEVPLHRSSGGWRLDAVAVRIELLPAAARERLSILGGWLPTGTVLLFPGALPIAPDTPYLQLDASHDNLTFDSPSGTRVQVRVSEDGRAAMLHAVRAALGRCLSGRHDPGCPLPGERYVPGSLSGVLEAPLQATSVRIESRNPAGRLRFSGSATVSGHWQRLNFHNRQVTASGRIDLRIHATAYATAPLRIRWAAT
jgi:hypothetical protein